MNAEIRANGTASADAIRRGIHTFRKVFGHPPEVLFIGPWHVPGVPGFVPEGHVQNPRGLLLKSLHGRCALVKGADRLYHIRLDFKTDGQGIVYRTPR